MRTYIYILRLKPEYRNDESWSEQDTETLKTHDKRIERLKGRGTIKLAGRTDLPISNKENFGAVIFEADDDVKAELVAQSDPAVMEGIMTAVCYPFKHLY